MSDVDLDDPDRDQFSVYVFRTDGSHSRELSFVTAKRAVQWAKWLTEEKDARSGAVSRIIITDGGDHTVFSWDFGQGVTYPPFRVLP